LPELVAYREGLFAKEGLTIEWADRDEAGVKTADTSLTDTASHLRDAIVRTSRALRQEAAAETGLSPPTAKSPRARAHSTGPPRNCQAESPAARATTSSEERVSRQKAQMPPSRMAKGRIVMTTQGVRSSAISTMRLKVASGREAERRSNSRKSKSETSPVRAARTEATATENCRLM